MGNCMAQCKRHYKEKSVVDKKNINNDGVVVLHEEKTIEDNWNISASASGSLHSDTKEVVDKIIDLI